MATYMYTGWKYYSSCNADHDTNTVTWGYEGTTIRYSDLYYKKPNSDDYSNAWGTVYNSLDDWTTKLVLKNYTDSQGEIAVIKAGTFPAANKFFDLRNFDSYPQTGDFRISLYKNSAGKFYDLSIEYYNGDTPYSIQDYNTTNFKDGTIPTEVAIMVLGAGGSGGGWDGYDSGGGGGAGASAFCILNFNKLISNNPSANSYHFYVKIGAGGHSVGKSTAGVPGDSSYISTSKNYESGTYFKIGGGGGGGGGTSSTGQGRKGQGGHIDVFYPNDYYKNSLAFGGMVGGNATDGAYSSEDCGGDSERKQWDISKVYNDTVAFTLYFAKKVGGKGLKSLTGDDGGGGGGASILSPGGNTSKTGSPNGNITSSDRGYGGGGASEQANGSSGAGGDGTFWLYY